MLRQVRFLRVRFAAQLADVRLQMLRVLVLGDVLEQGRLVGEALVARVALERFVRLMAPRVGLQVGQLGERFRAARMAALVRLVAGVRPDVLLQMGELGELALADLAPVRLDAEMYPRVLRQVARVGERFRALGAFVRFGFAHLQRAAVQLQVRLRGEDLFSGGGGRERRHIL